MNWYFYIRWCSKIFINRQMNLCWKLRALITKQYNNKNLFKKSESSSSSAKLVYWVRFSVGSNQKLQEDQLFLMLNNASLPLAEDKKQSVEYNAAFTHADLTTRYRTESLYKSNFLLSSSRNILFVKRIESLLHTASKKFTSGSFLVVKTAKCKRDIIRQQNK